MCIYVYVYIYIYIYICKCNHIMFIIIGWHYLSNATCIQPHLSSTALLVQYGKLIEFATSFATFEEHRC